MWTYSIPWQGKFIIYRPLLQMAFVGNNTMAQIVQRLGQPAGQGQDESAGAMAFLDRIGFLAPDPSVEDCDAGDDYRPATAVLCLTTACNFRCIYCYAEGGERPLERLNWEQGKAAIDLVCRNAMAAGRERFSLAFHGGGEPTQAWELMQRFIEYARRLPLPCEINLTTNGHWTPECRQWILDHIDSISLSLDGAAAVQNRQRPLAGGNESFSGLRATIEELDRRQHPYGIRMTVVDSSIDELASSVEFLCAHSQCRTFQVEPAFPHGRAVRQAIALRCWERFAYAFLDAYDIAQAAGRYLYYSGARPWTSTTRFCRAPQEALVVTADGHLSTCYEVASRQHPLSRSFFVGRIDKGEIQFDSAARLRFLERIQERRAQCQSCYCYWSCAGDCPSKTLGPMGNEPPEFGERCQLNRLLVRELLLRYMAAGNGLWLGGVRKQS